MAQSWGGPHGDDGGVCDACNKPITKRQLLMEGIASTLSEKPVQFHVLPVLGNGEARTFEVDLI
jgi:hypothetical protein